MGYGGFLELRKAVKSPAAPDFETKGMQLAVGGELDYVKRIMDAMMEARVINMFGNGDAIIPFQLLGMKLMKIGIPCWVVNDQDLQLLSASAMKKGDVALAVSHTGRS